MPFGLDSQMTMCHCYPRPRMEMPHALAAQLIDLTDKGGSADDFMEAQNAVTQLCSNAVLQLNCGIGRQSTLSAVTVKRCAIIRCAAIHGNC